MLEVSHLSKRWPRTGRLALDDVTFAVEKGEILGLLGHNGAGKSTVMGIMLGMVRPDAGEVRVGGVSVQRRRAAALGQIGAIYEAASFYSYLSGWQNLRALCSLSGWWDEAEARTVLRQVGLLDRADALTGTYSHGMRQRLALAQALLPRPKLLLLDEPTDGLDPEGIREFRQFVLRLRDEMGLTILLNSHLLGEVEQMCDRCVILRQGKKVYEGIVPGREQGKGLRYQLDTAQLMEARVMCAEHGLKMSREGLVDLGETTTPEELAASFVAAGVGITRWAPQRATLEEFYLQHSGPGV